MSDNAPRRDDLAGETAAHTAPTPGAAPAPRPTNVSGEADTTDTAAFEPEREGGALGEVADQGGGDAGANGQDGLTADAAEDGGEATDPAEQGSGGTDAGEPGADGDGVGPGEVVDASGGASEGPSADAGGTRGDAGGSGAGAASGDAEEDGPEGPGSGGSGGRKRRRVWRWVAVGVVAVLLVGGGGAAWLYHDLVGGIDQEHVDDRLGANRPEKLNKSLNILLIGSDTREGDNAEYAVPGMAGARSDTTILLHLSPNRDQAVGISFPRDSMVKIPACEKEKGGTVPAQFGMLNAAFAFAGPTCTWKTLESLTGIHIDHFVQVDFAGFKRMVDALGGVEICVDKPVNDPRAELHLPAGKQTVKGDEALGYVRARYSLGDGSDLERIERQQKFMAAVVDKATSGSVLTDPSKTYKFLKAATKSMTTDDDLDLAAMRKLADGLKGMSAGQVRFVTVPVERYAPDPNRVQWNESLAKPLFEAVRHDDTLPAAPAKPGPAQPAPLAPGKVNVTVVDAGGRDAQVERAVKQLRQRGYKVAKKVEKAADAPESRLVYAPSAEAQASALARDVPNAMLTTDPAGPREGVRLVIGENGVRLAPPAINKIGGGVKAGRELCD